MLHPQAEAGWSLGLPRALWLQRDRPLLGLWVIFHSTGGLADSSLAAWPGLLAGGRSQQCLMSLLPQPQEGLSSLPLPKRLHIPGPADRLLPDAGEGVLTSRYDHSQDTRDRVLHSNTTLYPQRSASFLNNFQICKRFWHLNRLLRILL